MICVEIFFSFSVHKHNHKWHEESKTNSMLHNGLLDLMNRSTCFGHYSAHHQELATIQMVSVYGSSPWLWQVAGQVHGCRFLERPVRGMFRTLFISSTMHGQTLIKFTIISIIHLASRDTELMYFLCILLIKILLTKIVHLWNARRFI